MNKNIPDTLNPSVSKAFGFFPELRNVVVDVKIKKTLGSATMMAQPQWRTLFAADGRRYQILINPTFGLSGKKIDIWHLPPKVLTGWIGHELGHIKDYENLSDWQLIKYGIAYLTSKKFYRIAERTADHNAVKNGMGDYIIATKRFLLDQAEISQRYKKRLKSLYLSPDEIIDMINEHQS